MEVINADYGDYVSLSTRLGSLDGAVLRLRQGLSGIAAQLAAVQALLQGELGQLSAGLERRNHAARTRATLELMQEVAHAAAKVGLACARRPLPGLPTPTPPSTLLPRWGPPPPMGGFFVLWVPANTQRLPRSHPGATDQRVTLSSTTAA